MDSPADRPLVSIIVITLNTPQLTRECLESVIQNTSVPYELVVVNNSRAGKIRRCLERFPNIRILQNRKNLGFARAANQGALAARAPCLCFLNSDALVPAGWLERLLKATRLPRAGAVGPAVQEGFGPPPWPLARRPVTPENVTLADRILRRRAPRRPATVPFLHGYCLLIPKQVFAKVGLFDEGYFFGGEDTDYSLRLRLAGYRLVRLPDLYVHHHGGKSCAPRTRQRMVRKSKEYFIRRWTTPLERFPSEFLPLLHTLDRRIPVAPRPIPLTTEAASPNGSPLLLRTGFVIGKGIRPSLVRLSDLEVFAADNAAVLESWRALSGLRTGQDLRNGGSADRRVPGSAVAFLTRKGLARWIRPQSASEVCVTVMMVAHNAQEWIAEAIESVLGQRFQDFELIVMDDGSTDLTPREIACYRRHPKVRMVQSPCHLSIPAARNRVVALARGRHIAVCDADDLMLPALLERFVPLLETDPTIGWVYSDRLMIGPPGLAMGVDRALAPNGRRELRTNVVAHAGALIRKDLILQVGGYDESLLTTEDYDLALKIMRLARIRPLRGEVHYVWRRHPHAASLTNPWAQQETRALLRRHRGRKSTP